VSATEALDHHTVPPPSRGRGPQCEAASDLFDLALVGSRAEPGELSVFPGSAAHATRPRSSLRLRGLPA
jgi:hypothetical protein